MIDILLELVGRLWARFRGRRYGTTMLTASGIYIWPLDYRPSDVRVRDIARGLANECRYAGQTALDLPPDRIFYSVAEHCVLVSRAAEAEARAQGLPEVEIFTAAREGLCHDGEEAIIGDVIQPVKYLRMMRGFRRTADRIRDTIFESLGIVPTPRTTAIVKHLDDAILSNEVVARRGVDVASYIRKYGGPVEGANVRCLSPGAAEAAWLARFAELWPGCPFGA